jgi:hypothetical protein
LVGHGISGQRSAFSGQLSIQRLSSHI